VKILVIGSGAREHTIIKALRRDTEEHDILAAPGNAGISADAEIVGLNPANPKVVTEFAVTSDVDLVVIGPEAPLVAGVANALRKAGVAVFGPNKEAAAIEGSKSFAKDIMAAAGVPNGKAWTVSTEEELTAALDASGSPYVVKADGLAAGKGVLVTEDREAAFEHATFYLQHGDVLVEESAMVSGLFPSAQRRITNEPSMAMKAPTRVEWAPTLPSRGLRMALWRE
jgi:phosphoribosylamine--glycine ligase